MKQTVQLHLTIVRHGRSMGNHIGFYAGHMDVDLNPEGREQAKLTGAALEGETFDMVFSSDMKRTVDTATLVLNGSGCTAEAAPAIQKDKLMRERGYGVMEGKGMKEITKYATQLGVEVDPKDPTRNFVPEGAETEEDVDARASEFMKKLFSLESLAERESHSILLSGHSGWIRGFVNLLRATGKVTHIPEKHNARPSNGAITKFTLEIEAVTRQLVSGKCTRFFDCSHISNSVIRRDKCTEITDSITIKQ